MADVRLASYAELLNEKQKREAADAAINERIDTVSKLDSIKRRIVQRLPSESVRYSFNDGMSRFTNAYRTSCTTVAEENGGFYQSITSSGNSNTYRRAYFDCANVMNNATRMVVELDVALSGRWQLGFADLSQRPGDSTGTTYTRSGVAFFIGTSDGTNLYICNSKTDVPIGGIWLHIKTVIDFSKKTTEYIITDRETKEILASGTADFEDVELTGITGFEAYTWATGTIKIDNIEIISSYGAQDDVIYMVPAGEGKYLSYVYTDDNSMLIGNSSLVPYSSKPQQTGTWLDGRPIWRVGFDNIPIPYISEESALYLDKSYTPFYDYENRCSKYVKSTDGVILLNGVFILNVSGVIVCGKRWNEFEYEADINDLPGFRKKETMYFAGYVEFVTEKENIKEMLD